MIKAYLLILYFIFIGFSSFSQNFTQTVRGTVVDSELETPLPGAIVIIQVGDEKIGTATDIDGKFKLENIPVGRQTIQVTFIGYEEQVLPNLLITSGKEFIIQIKLIESIETLEEVVIKAKSNGEVNNDMATVSARSFSVEETKRYAGSFDDPGRMAQSFAGVASSNDQSNEIVIRGNSPRGVLWRIEGIEVPNPNHFSEQGASGGGVSMLSSNMMSNSDFFTGAFPSEYGNAMSGVFDIRLRKGNNEKREYAMQLGVLGADAAFEGPFKKGYNGSYLINYRYSTLAILNKIGVDVIGDQIPIFQDLSYNISLPTKKMGNFTFFGIGGKSGIKEQWTYDNLDHKDDYNTDLGITGITHSVILSDHISLHTRIAATATRKNYFHDVYDSTEKLLYTDYKEEFISTTIRGNVTLKIKPNSKNTLKSGVIFSNLGYNFISQGYNYYTTETDIYIDQTGNTYSMQGFAAWKHKFNKKWILNTGLHYIHFLYNDQNSVEPRAGIQWKFKPGQSISAGIGLHSKIEDLTIYTAQETLPNGIFTVPNRNLGLAKALHYVLGYDKMINSNTHLKIETYYQNLFNIPIIDDINSNFSAVNYSSGYTTDSLTNKGTAKNYGVELTLEKYFSKGWYYMLTGSLYESKYVGGDGIERNTRYNGNYATSIMGGKEFEIGENSIIGFSFKTILSGGNRITPILLDESIAAGYTILDESRTYEEKAEMYFRPDFQILFRKNKKKTTQTLKLDIQNVINRSNVARIYFNPVTETIQKSTQMGIIPVLSYKVEF